ncbi:hypothetical protein [Bacillus sp. WP8]|nr:hypothetical protein [Bacillus sp. WP8]
MRSAFDIREHRRADLTPNARVCLHAEAFLKGTLFYIDAYFTMAA